MRTALRRFAAQAAPLLLASGILAFSLLALLSRREIAAYLSPNNLANIGVQMAVVAIAAVGVTVVIIAGGIDLSLGSVAALAGVLAAQLMIGAYHLAPWNPWAAGAAACLVGSTIGLVNGALVAWVRLPPFIVTLAMLLAARGTVHYLTGAQNVFGLPDSFLEFASGRWRPAAFGYALALPVPYLAIYFVAITGAVQLVLARTRVGRYWYAIGSNLSAARLSGVAVNGWTIAVYAVSGLLAAFAGIVNTARTSVGSPTAMDGLELDAIAAAVIGGASLAGGAGTAAGTLVGALLLAALRNGLDLKGLSSDVQKLYIGAAILLAVVMDHLRRRFAARATGGTGG